MKFLAAAFASRAAALLPLPLLHLEKPFLFGIKHVSHWKLLIVKATALNSLPRMPMLNSMASALGLPLSAFSWCLFDISQWCIAPTFRLLLLILPSCAQGFHERRVPLPYTPVVQALYCTIGLVNALTGCLVSHSCYWNNPWNHIVSSCRRCS